MLPVMKRLYEQILARACPTLSIQTCEAFPHGQFCDVFLINRSYVFRFPRDPESYEGFLREIYLLQRLEGRLPLPIPAPVYHGAENYGGPPFVGYRHLPGSPLLPATFALLAKEARESIAFELVDFLQVLHGFPMQDFEALNLPHGDTHAQFESMFASIQLHLYPRMSPDVRVETTKRFEAFLDDADGFDYSPCLRHGDFGPTNILIDDARTGIAGILDFGMAAIGDPAYDFAGLASYGEDVVRAARDRYSNFDGMAARIAFYRSTFGLQEALHGLRDSDVRAGPRG